MEVRSLARVLAPAKINLTLEILGRREDGYHALRSIMVPIALADELVFEPAERFAFACAPPSLSQENLVTRAFARIGRDDAPVSVTLRKRVPVGAGLGGGSSDAASVLRAAMSGAFGDPGARDWIADARALGSDVPFFLAGGPALVEGTGERVTALGHAPPWWVVLLVPDVHVATAAAYAALAASRTSSPVPTRPRSGSATLRCGEALQRGDYGAVLAAMTNDFEPVVRTAYPAVDATLRALDDSGAPGRAMLSGSGGACFALFATEDHARAFAARLRAPDGSAVHVVPFATSAAWVDPAESGPSRSAARCDVPA
ncbi:MAG: 4-diphosphocytidyl-2-C-methyl-D-erythritol kinase [Candidatus Eremiobacteraeota bacterium]|nr:4-diphosphocytidyl-2-C-methyl-D-erythritol kinase [Candidatus Eremiobacteraeota bacterium]